jgi:hypothetical protein
MRKQSWFTIGFNIGTPKDEQMNRSGFNFLQICRLYEHTASISIKTKKQRERVKEYILKARANNERVRCFRDIPGFIILASRKPRLDDFF